MVSEPTPSDRDAALRRLLVARAEGASSRRIGARRPAGLEPARIRTALVTGLVGAAVVAASVAVLTIPHDGGSGPVRAVDPAAPASSAPVATAPTPTTAVPSAPPSSTAPSIGPAPSDPTTAPSATVPSTAPVPSSVPSAPDPTPAAPSIPSPAPSAQASSGSLVAPTGWQVLTRTQLHDWVVANISPDDPANAAGWEEEAWLDIRCMAQAGYLYDPTRDREGLRGLTDAQRKGYEVAMYGPDTGAPYDWRTAGCHGRSVHETGNDDAH